MVLLGKEHVMAWKECDRMSLRREFANLAAVEGVNFSALCERFGVSRKTGYKWLSRFQEEGEAGLADRSRRPHRFRLQTADEIEQAVLEVRDKHPAWGGRKIRRRLQNLGRKDVPAPSTITAILHRNGRISEQESAKRRASIRFERSEPNELWQMDFKGEFKMTNGRWCYPLTVLDDHSRYSLVLQACGNQRRPTVQTWLQSAFIRYGLPQAMLMDNGPPWGVPCAPGTRSVLTVWLMDLDIAVHHGRPYHPQTQGKEERFHRTLKLELLQGKTFGNLKHTQSCFDPWRQTYNQERPHEALRMEVPASRYLISLREYHDRPLPFEYNTSFEVRKVSGEGRIVFQGRQYGIGKAFAGRWVGVRATTKGDRWDVYYRTFAVGTIDLEQGHPRRKNGRGIASARYARGSNASK
jgi:transposase InsO family protein